MCVSPPEQVLPVLTSLTEMKCQSTINIREVPTLDYMLSQVV